VQPRSVNRESTSLSVDTDRFRLSGGVRQESVGIPWQWQIVIVVLAVLAIISRRPDAVLNPQFYGEDGTIWYAEAYNFGWFQALFHPQAGYFQTLPRLAGALSLLVPLRFAPLVTNGLGIALQALPVCLLLSARCAAWAPLNIRGWFAITYIALPATRELDATITNGQWHLALLACIVVLAASPKTLLWRVFDVGVLLLDALTGPFCLLLLPIAGLIWFFRRERWRVAVLGILAAGALLQAWALYTSAGGIRVPGLLGASLSLFLRILGGQVYLAALIGQNSYALGAHSWGVFLAALAGTAVLVYCASKGPLELRLFILFAVLILAASLRSPLVDRTQPQWPILASVPGIRYWFFPMLAFIWALVWSFASSELKAIQVPCGISIFVFLFGVARDWRYPPYTDQHFRERAKEWESMAPGTVATLPIYPDGWTFRLTKKGGTCRVNPLGVIDRPAPNAKVSGPLTLNGWATANEHILRLSFAIDGVPVPSSAASTPRPDVDKAYPSAANPNKGWSTAIDTSTLKVGKHTLTVRVFAEGGCDAEIATLPFEFSR
jgi:hypothetical protein